MRKIDTSNWKPYKLTDLFDVFKGRDKDTQGKFPLITCTTSNRGRHQIKTSNTSVKEVFTVSGDGVNTGTAFWQKEPVGVFTNVNILKPKFEYTDNVCLFLEVVITKSLSPKYNYGKKLGLTRILEESVLLPSKDNEPDFGYMEEFMDVIKKEEVENEALKPKYKKGKIDTSAWKPYKLTDLFESNLPKKSLGECDCWEVTGQTTNNGRKRKSAKYNLENTFTISSVGAYCGTCFWHPYKFWLGNNVQGYKPKFAVTSNIGLFLCTIITKSFTNKFSYGKTASISRILKESILLPTKNNEPDFGYMEEFMENLKID